MHLGRYDQDPHGVGVGAADFVRGWCEDHARKYRLLARGAGLGPGFDRGGNQELVCLPGQKAGGVSIVTSAEQSLFERKIKTPAQLQLLLGPAPRERKVIMCHGTFDLVHPGHVRHLIYAKSKASILVTSLTCDAHIEKANHRPFVPQELRAMNLAALEVVDFVVIDPNPKPLENLRIIKPEYFAKGYEYGRGGIQIGRASCRER